MPKFADQRKQYVAAQEAMAASESIIKTIRRQLSAHIKEQAPLIQACLPPIKTPYSLQIEPARLQGNEARNGAAYQPFGVMVAGNLSWHEPTAKEVKAIKDVMRPAGWKTLGIDKDSTHWWINFA